MGRPAFSWYFRALAIVGDVGVNRAKSNLFRALCVLFGLLVAVPAAELFLRLVGVTPWQTAAPDPLEVTLHRPDPVLGWTNVPGRHTRPSYTPGGSDVVFTFLPDGSRITSPEAAERRHELVLLGGSFTQGQAVADDETYAWKLQQLLPQVRVRNYGTGGYGTYQSLLRLERALDERVRPYLVIYGFIEDHENRNVATASWLHTLSWYAQRGHVYLPYCTLDQAGQLRRHPPRRYPAWPLRRQSALVNFLQRSVAETQARGRTSQRREVTEQLLLAMKERCHQAGALFGVALLSVSEGAWQHYTKFCRQVRIPVSDCSAPLTKEMTVPGDGHPNGKLHTLWAERIASQIPRP